MPKHVAFKYKDGRIAARRISSVLGQVHARDTVAERKYLSLCGELGTDPSAKQRTYWSLKPASPPAIVEDLSEEVDLDFPDEVPVLEGYPEGAVKQVLVNAYERSPEARKACIEHYGVTCAICSFDFEARYGAIGSGFIHVHHLRPLAMRAAEYTVNPIEDLRPVCPNCHAMLHRRNPPFSIDEIKDLRRAQ